MKKVFFIILVFVSIHIYGNERTEIRYLIKGSYEYLLYQGKEYPFSHYSDSILILELLSYNDHVAKLALDYQNNLKTSNALSLSGSTIAIVGGIALVTSKYILESNSDTQGNISSLGFVSIGIGVVLNWVSQKYMNRSKSFLLDAIWEFNHSENLQ